MAKRTARVIELVDQLIELMNDLQKNVDGFTLNLSDNRLRYIVGIQEVSSSTGIYTIVEDGIDGGFDTFGGWQDEDLKKTVYDYGKRCHSLSEALTMASKYNQKEIFDTLTNECIKV